MCHAEPLMGDLCGSSMILPVTQPCRTFDFVCVACDPPACRMFVFVITEDVSCEFGSSKYYALCGFGGILSCGITHTAVVPLDLVKCRLQVCMEAQHGVAGRAQQLQPLQSK